MAKKPETLFAEKVVRRLKTLPRTWYVKTQLLSRLGIPDYLICCNGTFVAWELKILPNSPTKKQFLELAKIAKTGGISRVVYPETLDDAIKELRNLCF